MIQTLNSTAFRGESFDDYKQTVSRKTSIEENNTDELELSKQNVKEKTQDDIEKKSIKEKVSSAKNKFLNLAKTSVKTIETANGTAKGAVYGVAAAGITAFIGKNVQEGKGRIGATLAAMGKNVVSIIRTIATKTIPYIWNASPKNIVSSITKAPKAFYNYCSSGAIKGAKGSKTVAVLSTLAGAGTLGFNVIKGHMKGNNKSASIDHHTDRGHVKY